MLVVRLRDGTQFFANHVEVAAMLINQFGDSCASSVTGSAVASDTDKENVVAQSTTPHQCARPSFSETAVSTTASAPVVVRSRSICMSP